MTFLTLRESAFNPTALDNRLPDLDQGRGVFRFCGASAPCSVAKASRVPGTFPDFSKKLYQTCDQSEYANYIASGMLVAVHPEYARNRCGNALYLRANGQQVQTYIIGSCKGCGLNDNWMTSDVQRALDPKVTNKGLFKNAEYFIGGDGGGGDPGSLSRQITDYASQENGQQQQKGENGAEQQRQKLGMGTEQTTNKPEQPGKRCFFSICI